MKRTFGRKAAINWSRLVGLPSQSVGAFAVAAMLAACGGESSSSAKAPDLAGKSDIIAETFDDLPVCTDKREGVTAYVKDEKTAYICKGGDWTADEENDSERRSSIDGDAEGSFSGSDKATSSSSLIPGSSSGAYEQLDVVEIKDKSISGVSQKGPFVTGSAVKLYELEGNTYAQTGKSFTGKIASDDGKFSVAIVTLVSQYALLEANGFFRNEITGGKSNSMITLNALTDLSDRKSVNINLLTHLEYERALYLVGTGINVPSAKKQAEAEIFNAFGIQGEFANSEDLDIFSNGDGNAALLAFSVLMLRDLSEADFSELLTKFATDVEKDGSWDDEATKAKIADWAQANDLAGMLPFIRSNIESWNLGSVPDFEKYVRNFWYVNYGLGDCDKTREGEVMEAQNELSTTYGTQAYFICKSDAWVRASDIEMNTYGEKCTSADVGKIVNGVVTSTNKYYCTANGWVSLMGWNWNVPKEVRLNPGKTYGTLTDSRDGKKYKTVTIDGKTWMAENLNYYKDTDMSVNTRSWCYGKSDNKDSTTCDVTGRLYTWAAAMDSAKTGCGCGSTCSSTLPVQGICPTGWHLPSTSEWEALLTAAGGQPVAGKALRSQSGWADNGNRTDATGFSALPAGGRDNSGIYYSIGSNAYFWGVTESSDWNADIMNLYYREDAYLSNLYKLSAISVRCVENSK